MKKVFLIVVMVIATGYLLVKFVVWPIMLEKMDEYVSEIDVKEVLLVSCEENKECKEAVLESYDDCAPSDMESMEKAIEKIAETMGCIHERTGFDFSLLEQ